jgi:hypothetical protein
MKIIKLYFFTFLLLTGSFKGFAQQLDPSVVRNADSLVFSTPATNVTTPTKTLQLDRPSHFPAYTSKVLKYARVYVEAYPSALPLSSTSASLSGTITITGRNSGGVATVLYNDNVSTAKTISFTINASNPSLVYYNDFTTQFQSIPTLSAIDISATYTNNFPVSDIIRFKVRYEIAYGLNVNENASLTAPLVTNTAPVFSSTSPKVGTFSWNTNGRYYPAYQLQILRLYNNDANGLKNIEPTLSTTLDWNKSMTLNIENDLLSSLTTSGLLSFNYTIAEGTGLYVWRVRSIGNYQSGGFGNNLNWGTNWSLSTADGTIKNFTNFTSPSEAGYFYFSDPDDDKNWMYSRSFSEQTKINENIIYSDFLLNKKQVQTYVPSKQSTLLMQYVMDYMGRPSVSTLGVPQQNQIGLLRYKTKLMQNSTGALFRNKDFDSDVAIGSPSGITVSPVNGFEYYNNNTNKSIPNSGGFPYVRTVFENSSNSRMSEHSGLGIDHAIGTTHTIKTLYGTASDDELIRVLGDEAPKGNKVSKTTIIDANGTASIIYSDFNGKVIATCISENSTDITNTTLDPIPAYADFLVTEKIDNNFKASDGLLSTKRISFNRSTSVTFSYDIPCALPIELCGMPTPSPCKYKLVVVVHDVKNPSNRLVAEKPIDMGSCTPGANYHLAFVASDFIYKDQVGQPAASSLNFGPGDFIIEKRLVFDDANNATLVQQALADVKSKIEGFANGLVDELKLINTETDYYNFIHKYSCNVVQASSTLPLTFTLIPDNTSDCSIAPVYSSGQFKISVQPVSPTTPYSCLLTLTSECCNIQVPLEYIPPLVCPDPLTVTGPSDYQVFADYATTFLTRKGEANFGDANHFFPVLAADQKILWGDFQNYTIANAELKEMIYHMIHDVYSANPAEPAVQQYTCQNLANCWTNALNAITEYGSNAPIDNTTSSAGDDLNFDDMFDDMPGGGILKLFVGKKKKEKIKNEVRDKSQNAASSALSSYTGPSIIETFMDCAQYKYASVLVEMPSGQTSPFASTPCDQAPATILTSFEYSLYSNPATYDKFYRIYNFKYFKYLAGTGFRQYRCEAASCFCPPVRETPACNFNGYPSCQNDSELQYDQCPKDASNNYLTHVDWSFSQRRHFHDCIKNSQGSNPLDVVNPDAAGTADPNSTNSYNCNNLTSNIDPDYLSVSDFVAQLYKIETNCMDACENHRTDFKQKVRQMFIDNCYNIVALPPCSLGVADVPESDINVITDELVEQCKSMCDIAYLAGSDVTCTQCDLLGGVSRTYVDLTLGSARERMLVSLAKYGNIDLDIKSQCAADYGLDNCNSSTLTPLAPNVGFDTYGKDYNTSQNQNPGDVYFICAPGTFVPNGSNCPLEQIDPVTKLSGPVKVVVEVK